MLSAQCLNEVKLYEFETVWLQIYTSFYCRQNEPSYIKMVKLEILSAIADEGNAYEIATELTEYVNDIDEPLARAAVRAVGRIALEVMTHARCKTPEIPTLQFIQGEETLDMSIAYGVSGFYPQWRSLTCTLLPVASVLVLVVFKQATRAFS